LAVIEGQISGCELLVPKECTVFASVEGQISHETARTIVHKDTLQIGQKGLGYCRTWNVKTMPANLVDVAYLLGI
jgi:hypothetical protein